VSLTVNSAHEKNIKGKEMRFYISLWQGIAVRAVEGTSYDQQPEKCPGLSRNHF
jgi:hypothetical protein